MYHILGAVPPALRLKLRSQRALPYKIESISVAALTQEFPRGKEMPVSFDWIETRNTHRCIFYAFEIYVRRDRGKWSGISNTCEDFSARSL
jgi:hypothetical protein